MAKTGVLLAVLVAVAWHLIRQLRLLRPEDLTIQPGLLVASLVLFTGLGLLSCFILAGYLAAFGYPVTARSALALGTIPALAKYVPGKIHSVLGLAWLARSLEGIPVRVTLPAAMLYSVQIVTVSFVVSAALTPFTALPRSIVALLWLGALFCLLLITTPLMIAPVNWIARKLGRPELLQLPPTHATLKLLVVGLIQRTGAILAFGMMTSSLVDLPDPHFLDVGVSFILATTAGLVAVFAPAGIGVQEGFLVILLEQFMPGPQAAAVTVAARIWETAMTAAAACIGWVALVAHRQSHPETPDSDLGDRPH